MRTTTRLRTPFFSPTWLPTWSALTVGLALSAAGQAQAQVAQSDAPPAQVAQADAPPTRVAQATPVPTPSPAPAAPATPTPPDATAPAEPAATPPAADGPPLSQTQQEQVHQMMMSMPKVFVFDGYLRAGFGVNVKGGDQDAFQAPGAFAKYRLGNETETYGEIGLTANVINPDHADGAWLKTTVKLALVAPRNSTFDTLNAFAVREGWAQAGHVIESKPDMTFWAGQRFYRREDSHIIDFFFYDMSGYGAGFEDLKVGDKMKLAVAYLGGSGEYGMGAMQSDIGRLAKNTLDLRLYNVPAGNGTLEFWLIPTLAARGSLAENVANNRSGIGGGVFHRMPIMGGDNLLAAEFGIGGAANFSSGQDQSIAHNGWMLRFVDRSTFQLSPELALQATGVFQLDNRNGSANGSGGNMWISAGARPVYNITKHLGFAAEGGVDVVKAEAAPGATVDTGVLGKLTVAGLIRMGTGYYSRPELRAYVTSAFWNDAIKGQVGGPAFATDNFGLTMGVQMESWW